MNRYVKAMGIKHLVWPSQCAIQPHRGHRARTCNRYYRANCRRRRFELVRGSAVHRRLCHACGDVLPRARSTESVRDQDQGKVDSCGGYMAHPDISACRLDCTQELTVYLIVCSENSNQKPDPPCCGKTKSESVPGGLAYAIEPAILKSISVPIPNPLRITSFEPICRARSADFWIAERLPSGAPCAARGNSAITVAASVIMTGRKTQNARIDQRQLQLQLLPLLFAPL
jgi:hypothetical protein